MNLRLTVLSLRYSSWSMRPWLALRAAEVPFSLETVQLPGLSVQGAKPGPALTNISVDELSHRRSLGSVTGLFPVLTVDGTQVHESLAICEWVADVFPDAALWPVDPLDRARARSACCEMVSSFQALRTKMSCHAFTRVPAFQPDPATQADIRRVFEIWHDALNASGGPYLFGRFGIADCMYFPVLTRFRTYGIELDSDLESFAQRLEKHAAVQAWAREASEAPSIPAYDDYIRQIGGDPEAAKRT
jgi:glutathione S-transferase